MLRFNSPSNAVRLLAGGNTSADRSGSDMVAIDLFINRDGLISSVFFVADFGDVRCDHPRSFIAYRCALMYCPASVYDGFTQLA